MKVGIGYDVHRLVKGRKLIIGGVEIKYKKGLKGYSDADVLLHAIIDALIGAVGEHDIGHHFPMDDPRFKGISSLVLLKKIADFLISKGYSVINIDSTVVAEEPKMAPYVKQMKQNIATVLGISESCVNVKAKTEEGMGFTGKKLGISSYAVCLVQSTPLRLETLISQFRSRGTA